jgi:hypothetical protein
VCNAYRARGRKPAQLSTVTVWLKPEFLFTNAVHVEERYEAWVNGDKGTTKKSKKSNKQMCC